MCINEVSVEGKMPTMLFDMPNILILDFLYIIFTISAH